MFGVQASGYDAAMVTYGLSAPRATIRVRFLPTREELRVMFTRPSVIITGMVCATLVTGGGLFSITWLAMHERGTEAIGGLLLGITGLILGRQKSLHDAVKQVQTVQAVQAQPSPEGNP